MFTIAFATFSAFWGLHMWVEHPDTIARHARAGAPSIWYLEQMMHLQLLPVTRIFRVHHNDYGGTASKPTRLMAVRLPTLSRRLNQCLQRVPATLQLRGRDQFGNWRTSHAKEYPLRLSRALGHSMVDACRSFPLHNHAADFSSVLESLRVYMPQVSNEAVHFGADFVDAIPPVHRFSAQWPDPSPPPGSQQ